MQVYILITVGGRTVRETSNTSEKIGLVQQSQKFKSKNTISLSCGDRIPYFIMFSFSNVKYDILNRFGIVMRKGVLDKTFRSQILSVNQLKNYFKTYISATSVKLRLNISRLYFEPVSSLTVNNSRLSRGNVSNQPGMKHYLRRQSRRL